MRLLTTARCARRERLDAPEREDGLLEVGLLGFDGFDFQIFLAGFVEDDGVARASSGVTAARSGDDREQQREKEREVFCHGSGSVHLFCRPRLAGGCEVADTGEVVIAQGVEALALRARGGGRGRGGLR